MSNLVGWLGLAYPWVKAAHVTFVIFWMVKVINHFRRKAEHEPDKAAPPPRDVQLLEEIRDLLKNRTKS